jgi:hypothetical protein
MNKRSEKKMNKKRILLLYTILILSLLLAACSGTTNQTTSSKNGSDEVSGGTGLSLVNLLLIGTFKLEDTDQAITADEAATLLPLWQAYRSLSTSQTSAEAEVEALVNQIQGSMSPSQMSAINDMDLTNTDMMDLMVSLGGGRITRGSPNPEGTPASDFPPGGLVIEGNFPPSGDFQIGSGNPSNRSSGGTTRDFPPGGGGIVGGGPGGDAGVVIMGQGPMMQGTPDPSMQATAQARFGTMANRVNVILLDQLISILEEKIINK